MWQLGKCHEPIYSLSTGAINFMHAKANVIFHDSRRPVDTFLRAVARLWGTGCSSRIRGLCSGIGHANNRCFRNGSNKEPWSESKFTLDSKRTRVRRPNWPCVAERKRRVNRGSWLPRVFGSYRLDLNGSTDAGSPCLFARTISRQFLCRRHGRRVSMDRKFWHGQLH